MIVPQDIGQCSGNGLGLRPMLARLRGHGIIQLDCGKSARSFNQVVFEKGRCRAKESSVKGQCEAPFPFMTSRELSEQTKYNTCLRGTNTSHVTECLLPRSDYRTEAEWTV
jgi:hypothetical protein